MKNTARKHAKNEIEAEDIEVEINLEAHEVYIGQLNAFEMHGGVNIQEWEQCWELVKVNVDSGAIDNVRNKEAGEGFVIKNAKGQGVLHVGKQASNIQ
jgi:small nuclear ribonucleoprotein (snRNP)-like protein